MCGEGSYYYMELTCVNGARYGLNREKYGFTFNYEDESEYVDTEFDEGNLFLHSKNRKMKKIGDHCFNWLIQKIDRCNPKILEADNYAIQTIPLTGTFENVSSGGFNDYMHSSNLPNVWGPGGVPDFDPIYSTHYQEAGSQTPACTEKKGSVSWYLMKN